MNSTAFKTESIQEYFDKYASEVTKKELCNVVYNTNPVIERDGVPKQYEVIYIGRTINWRSNEKDPDLNQYSKEFFDVINWGVSEGYLIHGQLAPFIWMPLIGFSDKGEWVNHEGATCMPDQLSMKLPEGEVWTKRAMMLLYVPCILSRTDFNNKASKVFSYNVDFAVTEGALPAVWEGSRAPKD